MYAHSRLVLIALLFGWTTAVSANDLNTAIQHLRAGEFKQALPILQTLAGQGDVLAQGNLATMYLRGDGVSQDMRTASMWYEKVANSGLKHQAVVDAMFQLASLYRGYREHPKDFSKVAYWYAQAAQAGDVEAMNQLGILYYDGNGVEKDYAMAYQWFSKAADQDHPEAQSFIGDLYRFGRSVKQDYAEAIRWYEKAAKKNYTHALFMLGALHGTGSGVTPDRAKANAYYERAARQGHSEAKKILAEWRAQSPVKIVGVTLDPDYGYTAQKPIRTGSAAGHRAYLDRLRGPGGQSLLYKRTGACAAYKYEAAPFGQALIDCYTITFEGQEKPITLFLDLYQSDMLWVPVGMTYIE